MKFLKPIARFLLPILAALGLLAAGASSASATPPPSDLVRIPSTNLDFGEGGLLPPPVNDPAGFGTLQYDISGGTIKPVLTGKLYLNNALGMHARMQMEYYDVFGTRLANKHGGEVVANSNALHTFSVNLAPYSNPSIYKVVVSTTYKLGTNWYVKASQTVFV